MPIEYEVLPFFDWLFPAVGRGYGALAQFVASASLLTCIALAAWYLVSAYYKGPSEAFFAVAKVIYKALSDDLPNFSLRRTLAISGLTVKESIRRRAIIAFIIFVVVLLFAGLFLDTKSTNPGRLYLGFVLWTTNLLVISLSMLISTFSLPNDIKNRTIYTLATKPLRPGEIVLGRFLGFSAIGTAVLLVMGVIGYLFVYTGLRHEHVVRAEQIEQLNPGSTDSLAARGRTSFNKYHAHDFTVDENGEGQTELEMGHTHRVRAIREGDKVRYEVGPHEGMLLARVPLYGKLRFLDRQGRPAEKGVNVGNEWTYRSYIEGKTNSTAIWTFNGVSENYFVPNADGDQVLPLELSLSVFRTFKGNIEETVLGEMVFVNPNPRAKIRRSEPITFRSKEYVRQELPIKRQTRGLDADGRLVDCDLYNDLFVDGQVEIHVKCGQPAQYFGMAQPDLFVQGPEQPFWRNFIKGYVSIWLQMMMVTSLGVMFSTFLSGSVSLLSTVVSVIFGFFEEFVLEKFNGIFQGPEGFKRFVRNLFGIEESIGGEGGGLFESIIRMVRQLNLTADLEIGFAEHIVKFVDMALILMLRLLLQVFPDFSRFDNSNYVAYGFNVDGNLLLIQTTTALAFTVCTSIIGYFFLKTRELAA